MGTIESLYMYQMEKSKQQQKTTSTPPPQTNKEHAKNYSNILQCKMAIKSNHSVLQIIELKTSLISFKPICKLKLSS